MSDASTRRRLVAVLPNLLSALRLALAAGFPFATPAWRLATVVAAGLSDWLDGYIARRFDVKTASGQLLDAAADKLFVFSVLVTVTLAGVLDWWQMLLVIARDLVVTGVAVYVVLRREWSSFRRLVPRLPGKLTTGFQFALFVTLLVWPDTTFATIVFVLTALVSTLAGGDYLSLFATAWHEDQEARRVSRG